MRDIINKLALLMKYILDSRFRNDLKAVRYAEDVYIHFCIEELDELGVIDAIETGATLDEICEETGIEHEEMLEHMVNVLVTNDLLNYSNGVYSINQIEDPVNEEQYEWLEENYPASKELTLFMYNHTTEVLKAGEPVEGKGLEEEFLDLWYEVTNEFPYSFKKILLDRTFSDLEEGDKILDVGCGRGSVIEMILRNVDKNVEITGIDLSQGSLDAAEKRLEEMKEMSESQLIRSNIDRVKLVQCDLTELSPEDQYDYVVISLLFNHIPAEEREEIIKKMAEIIKPEGKLGIFQFIHPSEQEPLPFWMEYVVPTHSRHPTRDNFFPPIEENFSEVNRYLEDTITVAIK